MKFVGNFFHDHLNLEQIHDFLLRDDVDLSSKREALEIMTCKGMGIDDPCTDDDVLLYVDMGSAAKI